jgi:hypothetical protein
MKLGLFSKKEKIPGEQLVDELVGSGPSAKGNLNNLFPDNSAARAELQEIVQMAWINGASVSEIQRIYDDNLLRLKKEEFEHSSIFKEEGAEIKPSLKEKEGSGSFYKKHMVPIGVISFVLVVFGVVSYGLFFMEYTYADFNEFEVDGILLNIPTEYKLTATGENGGAFFNKYFNKYNTTSSSRTGSGRTRTTTTEHTVFIEAYVYKSKSVPQVVSSISSEGWDVYNTSYGNYSGYRLERFGHYGGWFIFEKEGKTVALYYDQKAIKDNMEKIIT